MNNPEKLTTKHTINEIISHGCYEIFQVHGQNENPRSPILILAFRVYVKMAGRHDIGEDSKLNNEWHLLVTLSGFI